ncbi:MAG: FtsX-like permease family protein, partial [Alphaproteobacteria bacterium]
QAFHLAATFDVGLFYIDSGTGFMDLGEAQSLFKKPDAVSGIEVAAAESANVDLIYTDIYVALERAFVIADWRNAGSGFLAMVKTQRNVMFLVLSLIILVAAINIISGQIMLVNGKTRDIAILRTMGASRKNILKTFFLVGGLIGVVGTCVGVLLGWLFAVNIDTIRLQIEKVFGVSLFDPEVRILTELPSNVEGGTLAFVVLMSMTLTLGASLYPAWKAARLSPTEGIRNG